MRLGSRLSGWCVLCGLLLLGAAPKSYAQRSVTSIAEQTLEWTELGPTVQPLEPDSGGRGVPNYAMGRGTGTGRINHLYVPHQRKKWVFACSPTGGLFWSKNLGENWSPAGTDPLPVSGVSAVAVHPRRARSWAISTGDGDDQFAYSTGIWITRNAGKTWENISTAAFGRKTKYTAEQIPYSRQPEAWVFISDVVLHPKKPWHIFACTSKGMYRANNAWQRNHTRTWKQLTEEPMYDLEFHPKNANIAVAGGAHVWMSIDGGQSFEQVTDPPVTTPSQYKFIRYSIDVSPSAPDVFYVVRTCSEKPKLSGQGESYLLQFDVRTKAWKVVGSLKKGVGNVIPTRARAFAVHPKDTSQIVAANVQPVHRSGDGGKSFVPIAKGQMHDDVHHLLYHPKGHALFASHDGGVSVSWDGGETFENRDRGIGAANVFGLSVAQTQDVQVLYGGYDTGGNLLKDGTWRHVSWGDGFQTVTDAQNANQMFATKQSGHIDASDDGLNFDRRASSSVGKSEWHTWIRQNDAGMLFASGDVLGRSSDGGRTWQAVLDPSTLNPDYKNCYRFYTCPGHPEVLYVYVIRAQSWRPALLRSFNVNEENVSDIRWEEVNVPREFWISALAISPENPRRVVLSYKHGNGAPILWELRDDNWSSIESPLGSEERIGDMLFQAENPTRLVIGSEQGVWTRTVDGANTSWTLNKGLPGCQITGVVVNHVRQTLVVSTFGRGIWEVPLSHLK